uniref:Uncharacterized protein n=1 Tax=Zooxanthella nutricula TaxID=1333877 RepID=A0A6U8W5V5_9DINO|mmetsp:Transcript_92873/g.284283  ORF Transcript_92873/g.284283 Transcript_92873/m.284283 type:complete len:116 (+) Transcript_92873:70-417(+)
MGERMSCLTDTCCRKDELAEMASIPPTAEAIQDVTHCQPGIPSAALTLSPKEKLRLPSRQRTEPSREAVEHIIQDPDPDLAAIEGSNELRISSTPNYMKAGNRQLADALRRNTQR